MKPRRVKAFTLLEVIVTMAVISVLVGITYSAYRVISISYATFSAKNREMASLEKIDELLGKDFERAELIERYDKGVIMQGPNDTVRYELNDDFIVRFSTVSDTFRLKNANFTTTFENAVVDGHGLDNEENRIDGLTVSLLFRNETIPLRYVKIYSSANLFNRR